MTPLLRVVSASFILLATVLGFAAPAAADPPGPTDFRTEVLAITPASDAFAIEIIGGDSFVLLRQINDAVIEVVGYNGEPYLRFLADGTVEQNLRSPATYLNEERFGDTIPAIADADAPPEWEVVATDGSYAWHDHRAHWMLQSTPFDKGPGDQILEAVIPLRVDGVEVDLRVASYWEPRPSLIPLALGAIAGLGLVTAVWRRPSALAAMLAVGAAIALAAGFVQYRSVPSETGPSLTLIAVPLIALAVAIGAHLSRHRPATALPLAIGSAASLVAFAALRLPTAHKAILPTDLSMPLDRAISAGVAALALGCLVVGAASFSRLLQAEPSATAPVH